MSKVKIFLTLGIVMWIGAILFVIVMSENPGMSLPVSMGTAKIIYIAYLLIMVAMFVLAARFGKKKKK